MQKLKEAQPGRLPKDQMLALWKQGKTDKEISAATGVSVSSVSSWRFRSGLALNPERAVNLDPELLRKWHSEGLSDAEIAKRFGVTKYPVFTLRTKLGLPAVPRPARMSPERAQEIARLYQCGETDKAIAKKVGCDVSTVQKWRYRNSLPVNCANGQPSPSGMHSDRMELYLQGLDDGEIAERCGVGRASIFGWRKRRGLPPNKSVGGQSAGPKVIAPLPVTPDGFFMTDDEILSNWRRADNRKEQVQILADLNACSRERIEEKLEALGVDLALEFGPKKGRRRSK